MIREWNDEQLDLTALYYASRFYGLGQFDLVYDATSNILLWNEAPRAWEEMADALGQESDDLTAYVYPPLWAWLISFASIHLSPHAFFNVANAFFTVGFVAGLLAAGRVLGAGTSLLVWVVVSLILVEMTVIGQLAVQLGQPQILVTGIMLAAFAAYHRSMPLAAGGLLGLAAAIKISPLIFAVIFLVDRNWRALAAFAVIGGGLGLLSIAVAGWPLHNVFLDRLSKMDEMIMLSRINISLQATATFFMGGAIGHVGYIWVELPVAVRWLSPGLALLSVAALVVLRRRCRETKSLLASLLVLGFAMPLSSPLGWLHYLLFVLGLAPGIIAFMTPHRAVLILGAFGLIFSSYLFQLLFAQHLAISMVYSVLWTTSFCVASFLFGLPRRDTPRISRPSDLPMRQ